MKAIVIIGSPRKKSCYKFSEMIIDNIKKNDVEIEEEYLFLKDYDLKFCRGCGLCVEDENLCPIKDDFKIIDDKMKNSNLLILVSPVYENNVSGIMKNFLDRFHYLYFRPQLLNVFGITVSVSSRTGLKEVSNYLDYTMRGWGCRLVDNIKIETIRFYTDDKYKQLITDYIIKTTENTKKNILPDYKQKIKLIDLIIFKDHKKFIFAYKEKYPVAYNYWIKNNWLSNYYFNNSRIGILKKIFLYFASWKLSKN